MDNMNTMKVDTRASLLHRIQVCGFVLDEVRLFLDTHPDNLEALNYYKKYLLMEQEAVKLYTQNYGPMSSKEIDNGTRWKWVDGPWPWENQSEV